jgi:plasmid stabilization system protein ParE
MENLKIIWTNTAKMQLKAIYEYYKIKSIQGAKTIKDEMLNTTKSIRFAEQYQRDEIEPEYRKIIVRDYKILYLVEDNMVYIARIFNTKQNPDKQKEQ